MKPKATSSPRPPKAKKPKPPMLVAAEARLAATTAELTAIRAERSEFARAGAELAKACAEVEADLAAAKVATLEPLFRAAHAQDKDEEPIRVAATALHNAGSERGVLALAAAFPWVLETVAGFERAGHVDMLLVRLHGAHFPNQVLCAAMVAAGAMTAGGDEAERFRGRLRDTRGRLRRAMPVMMAARSMIPGLFGGDFEERVAAVERRRRPPSSAERIAEAFLAAPKTPRKA